MAYNTTASLDKLTCTDFVAFGKCHDRFCRLSWSKSDSNYLVARIKAFRKDDTRDFRLVQNITLGESDLSMIVRLRNQLAVVAEQFGREQSLCLIQITTMSNDMEKQLKPVHKVVHFVDCLYRKICVTAAI